MSPEEMEEVFGNEANYNVRENPRGPAEFPDGSNWVSCTNWAHYVRRVLGDRAQIFGFDQDENPASQIAQECGGHDFAVVDERYIVDGWIKNVDHLSQRAVFDLDDPDQADEIRRYYGDRSAWGRGDANEAALDRESPATRARAMEGTRFLGAVPVPSFG